LFGQTDNNPPLGGPYWNFAGPLPKTEVDVQAAVTVIGRRDPHHDAGTVPNLGGSCLVHADVAGAFAGANFRGSKLAHAAFYHADLRCAFFFEADLAYAYLKDDKLNRAWLGGIKAKMAIFAGADMRSTVLAYADLQRATLVGANLSGAALDGAILTDAWLDGGPGSPSGSRLSGVHYSAETKWPADYKPPASTDTSTDIGSKRFTETPAECLRAAG
jgi:uncharacterized protein YjbI with pentapeptide repeats